MALTSVDTGNSRISNLIKSLTIHRPDDWHVHLREGAILETVLPYTARQFARAIVMPNLTKPITSLAEAKDYRSRIIQALPDNSVSSFTPLMTAYLTDLTNVDDLVSCLLYTSDAADE